LCRYGWKEEESEVVILGKWPSVVGGGGAGLMVCPLLCSFLHLGYKAVQWAVSVMNPTFWRSCPVSDSNGFLAAICTLNSLPTKEPFVPHEF